MISRYLILPAALLAVSGCKEEPVASPSQTYLDYYALVAEGRSFEDDTAYHAKARRDEVLGQLEARASSSDQSVEAIKALYITFTQSLAKCGELTLREERIADDTATVVFDVKDTCTGGQNDGTLTIGMVNEDGWKILSDELKVGSD